MEKYLEEVSNWYIRLNRRRFWKSGDPADKAACYNALHAGLRSAALALAPVTPFLAEEIWQNAVRPLLPEAAESVHHARWPEPPAAWRDEGLLQRAETVRKTITLALRLREKAKLRVRQPLAALYVRSDGAARQALQEQSSLLQSELNVKEVKFLEAGQASPEGFPSDAEGGLAVALDTTLTDALRREGLARDLVRKLQILRKESGLSITQRIELGLSTEDAELKQAIQDHRDHIMEELLAVRLEDKPLPNGDARQDLVLAGAALSATLRPAAQPS
jgi:isoleucyl-tRNA synthetase